MDHPAHRRRPVPVRLAWHIAHQPFGVVAGAKATARLDYAEDLYRDWCAGGRSGGGASARIDAEFTRIRRELGDLPGVIASPARLRIMLAHLVKTLHPGILNDCFYQPATAVCRKQAKTLGRPLPLHNMCLHCLNARRATVHLPRLQLARDQAAAALDLVPPGGQLRRCNTPPSTSTSPTSKG